MTTTHYLGTAYVDGHRLRYEAVLYQAGLRISFTGPAIGQRGDTLGLRVSAPLHLEWATDNSEQIVSEAVRIWNAVQHDCDG